MECHQEVSWTVDGPPATLPRMTRMLCRVLTAVPFCSSVLTQRRSTWRAPGRLRVHQCRVLSSVSFVPTGTTLTVCVDGAGTVATGTVSSATGAFTLVFDTNIVTGGEFGLCALTWGGTFTLDGNSMAGTETNSSGCAIPNVPCCLPPQSRPISGTRTSTTVSCCGNGVVEPGEQCDNPPNGGQNCCGNLCTYAPSGTFCGADDQCHLKECDGAGACLPLPARRLRPVLQMRSRSGMPGEHPQRLPRWRLAHEDERQAADPVVAPEARLDVEGGVESGDDARGLREPADVDVVRLCVFNFDLIPSGFPRYAVAIPPDQDCLDGPCWKQRSNGFKYGSRSATPNGVRSVTLRARSERRSIVKMKGKGVSLFPPIENPVVVQLSAGGGACWSSTFTSASENSSTRYLATIP